MEGRHTREGELIDTETVLLSGQPKDPRRDAQSLPQEEEAIMISIQYNQEGMNLNR